LDFFAGRGHKIIPSASLVPENDPSVLFTTAGMQPLVPYLLGEPHPEGRRIANVQKCVRTQDIEEVGDNTHDTFFEMLGNWSLGDYFKEDTIKWSHEFLTSEKEGLGLDPKRLYVTVFAGDENAPRDDESFGIWKSLGIPESRIYFMGADSNWWSPGDNGPCGPDTEMFYDVTEEGLGDLDKNEFIKADDEQKVVEIWNDVFMEYQKKDGKVVGKLSQQNVDTGAGLERLVMVMQGKDNIFDTDLFEPLVTAIKESINTENEKAVRIVADHIRTAVFMISDGVIPSNTDRGYILRRLIRRAVRYADVLGVPEKSLSELAKVVIAKYKDVYKNLSDNESLINDEISKEEEKFRVTLQRALRVLNTKRESQIRKVGDPNPHQVNEGVEYTPYIINGEWMFDFYQTYGFPFEMLIEELLSRHEIGVHHIKSLRQEFDIAMDKHQKLSQAGATQKFKGGLAGHGEMETKYHTATHLLHQALREVLGEDVLQKGSNITPERLRFDFSYPEKMTDEQKAKVEQIVNEQIKKALPVSYKEMPLEEAKKLGAIGVFDDKYGEMVKVYQVGDKNSGVFSMEFCGGPHVENTNELGRFKIKKEESISAGVRRIKAVLE